MDSPVWFTEFGHLLEPPTFLNFLPPLDGSHLLRRSQQQQQMTPVKDAQVGENGHANVHSSHPAAHLIQLAKPYIFEQTIQDCLARTGVPQSREDNIRLAGVQWIDNVRRTLKLPVKTFNTAVVYYHKFRLMHADGEYSYVDASAAALFAACKIEDTLKKSRDILCAAYNLKLPPSEHLSPDDSLFEHHSRSIIGLERLMLEASSFDFRNRHPQQLMIKLAKHYGLAQHSAVMKTAYGISLDIYRTFAPLKQTTAAMAFACIELAGRLHGERIPAVFSGQDYRRWKIGRAMVMETLLDLLELYTHYRTSTSVGPDFAVDTFLETRIPLNKELDDKNLPRYTEFHKPHNHSSSSPPSHFRPTTNGNGAGGSHALNGTKPSPNIVSPRDHLVAASTPSTPSTSNTASNNATNNQQNTSNSRLRLGERGRDGTVRFMLNPDREREEKAVVAEYLVPPDEDLAANEPVPPVRRR